MIQGWRWLSTAITRIGHDEADDEEVRRQKRLLVAIALMVSPAAIVWRGIYLAFDEPLAGSIPLTYAAVSLFSIAVFGLTCRYGLFSFSQLVTILVLPFLLSLAIGGFVNRAPSSYGGHVPSSGVRVRHRVAVV